MSASVKRFRFPLDSTARDLLQVAHDAARVGETPSETTLTLGPNGELRIFQNCPQAGEWPLDSVAREAGAQQAFRLAADNRGIVVEAQQAARRLRYGSVGPVDDPQPMPRGRSWVLAGIRVTDTAGDLSLA